jgi:heme O synthase-like polyprenyltransferase
LFIAPGGVDPLLGTVSIISITEGAGAAGVLNMWYDVDIDTLDDAHGQASNPDGKVSRAEALRFGLAVACSAVAVSRYLRLRRRVLAATSPARWRVRPERSGCRGRGCQVAAVGGVTA